MADQPPALSPLPPPVGPRPPERGFLRHFREFFALRKEIPLWETIVFALLGIAVCFALWWAVTRGEPEERLLSPTSIPSPEEAYASFPSLWFDQELSRNLVATLQRVVLGFGLAALVGIPLGVLCGCFSRCHAFFN